MVTAKAARRRGLLPWGLLSRVCSGALVLGLALPGVSLADPYVPTWEGASEPPLASEASCPAGPEPITEEEAEELDPLIAAIRAGRLEAAEACARGEELAEEQAHRSWWLVSELASLGETLKGLDGKFAEEGRVDQHLLAIEEALQAEKGLPVEVRGYPKPLEVEAGLGGLEVDAEQLDVSDEAVLEAVTQNTETDNQNWWGIAGLIAGALMLFWVWRMVRP